ncbi:DNA mismatch repair endonuclease MutL [Marinisporobacter balticus]|nr:DNA mismatch repair endonuclease MutL [Marinisporobacter balticus]
MIKRIHKLEKFIANKIAAGEVVDRPASVVKELVENAIDAKSSKIIVEIKEGGKTYIRITDNGVGIHESDVEIAFERHATSKIRNVSDLDSILSLGFRGEALASIASVSILELITKTRSSDAATYLELHGGVVRERKEVGSPSGTSFVVKNLFYNVPVRLQFMKSNVTETSYISDLISKFALAYPDMSFRFISNGTIIFSTSGSSSVITNIANIYGKEMARNMIYVSKIREGMALQAYISKPTLSRGNKQLQVFFVNGRYVKNKIISEAIEEAYKTLVTINKFPICFIYLNIPPNHIDVNIHPTKTEIRFNNASAIKELIVTTLKNKLLEENLVPNVNFEKQKKVVEGYQERIIDLPAFTNNEQQMGQMICATKEIEKADPLDKKDKTIKKEHIQNLVLENKSTYVANNKIIHDSTKPLFKKAENTIKDIDEAVNKQVKTKEEKMMNDAIVTKEEKIINQAINKNEEKTTQTTNTTKYNNKNREMIMNIKILGQIFNTYLIGQDGENMYLIDQHAAHERILYDTLLKNYKTQIAVSQKLLVPIVVELSFGEFEIVKKHIDLFIHLGFEIEEFGMNAFILRSVPIVFGKPEVKRFFIEIVDGLQKEVHNSYDLKVEKIISMSCKQAIKANDRLEQIEIDALMKQLAELENPFTCPHGRPIIVSMTKYEIEKKFKRV